MGDGLLADSVERTVVAFESAKVRMAGTLYRPADAQKPLPGVIVTGAWMTVKEQMPATYAHALAERGYAALTFDFRGWGESGGQPRQKEDPAAKIADIVAAARFLSTQDVVDAQRIGGLGVCASAGYMVHAAEREETLRSVALVAPWLHDRAILESLYGGSEAVDRLIATGRHADAEYRSSGKQMLVPAASRTDANSIMYGADYYTEADRGLIPAWRNEADVAFWEAWLTYDAQEAAPRFAKPFFMVQSEAAALPAGARRFYAALSGNKHELWLDGISQFDFYDQPGPVGAAAVAVADHFRQTLS